MDSAEFFLGTVTAVSSADGIQIQLDGQDEAMSKYYKMMITGANVPSVGDRVVVMKHSGTYVVMGKIGTPSQDAGKVNRGGDTMTGALTIADASSIVKDNRITSGTAPLSDIYGRSYYLNDSNGFNIATLQLMSLANGREGFQLVAGKKVNGANKFNYMRLNLDANGDPVVELNAAAAWRTALGALYKAGDTMTGLLNINMASPGVIAKTTGRASSDTVATNTNSYGFRVVDKNGDVVALYTDRYNTTGEYGALIAGYRMVNGTNTANNLQLLVDAAGNKLVYVTSPGAWRKALGLGTNGAFPITVAQGGTGAASAAGHAVFAGPNASSAAAPSFRALVAADIPVLTADHIPNLNASKITAGTLPIARGGTGNTGTSTVTTLANIATAGTNITLLDATFSNWGKLAMLYVHGKTTAAIADNALLFTVVSGKRPVSRASAQIGRSQNHCAMIGTDGTAVLGGSISSGTEFSCFTTYLLP